MPTQEITAWLDALRPGLKKVDQSALKALNAGHEMLRLLDPSLLTARAEQKPPTRQSSNRCCLPFLVRISDPPPLMSVSHGGIES